MDGERFDRLVRRLTHATTRRRFINKALAFPAAALGLASASDASEAQVGCRPVGLRCKSDHECCEGSRCGGGRCVCPAGVEACNGSCMDCPLGAVSTGECTCACPDGRPPCHGVCCTDPIVTCMETPYGDRCLACGDVCDGYCDAAGRSCFCPDGAPICTINDPNYSEIVGVPWRVTCCILGTECMPLVDDDGFYEPWASACCPPGTMALVLDDGAYGCISPDDPKLCTGTHTYCRGETEVCCDGVCTDIWGDRDNCGGCGDFYACREGQACCNKRCTDLMSDPDNCGGCGAIFACASFNTCINGVCQ